MHVVVVLIVQKIVKGLLAKEIVVSKRLLVDLARWFVIGELFYSRHLQII